MIILDIINLLLDVFLHFNITLGIIALPLLLASWFIVILSILSVVLGIIMIYNPFASLLTIAMLLGVYFIINGIIHIIQAFFNHIYVLFTGQPLVGCFFVYSIQ